MKRTRKRYEVGIFGFPRDLLVFLHDEPPHASAGHLNGRCSEPTDFDITDEAVAVFLTRDTIPTHVSFWHGERFFGSGPLGLNDLPDIGYVILRAGAVEVLTLNEGMPG